MATPKLDKIEKQMKSGEAFSLTNSQYKKSTGLDIPKNNNYLVKESAVAKKAKLYGYKIIVHERQISFEKET